MARNSTIWEFTNELNHQIFLVGTMHVGSSYVFRRRPDLIRLIEKVDRVYTETDLDQLNSLSLQNELLIENGKHIKDFISSRQYRKFRLQLLKMMHLDLDQIGRYQPLVIQNIISQKMLAEDEMMSMDQFIYEQAYSVNKPCLGLETVDEQKEIFREFSFKSQIVLLKRNLANLSKFRKQHIKLAKLYSEERIHQLYQITKNGMGMYKNLLIYGRNQIMAERILKLPVVDSSLIAVGAAHLSGEKGILHRLTKKGYKVQPL